MVSKNVSGGNLHKTVTMQDSVNSSLDRILHLNPYYEFVDDIVTHVLPEKDILDLAQKENKSFEDYVKLGIYNLFKGEVYKAQGQFQEALKFPKNTLHGPLRAVSSNILSAHTYLENGLLSDIRNAD